MDEESKTPAYATPGTLEYEGVRKGMRNGFAAVDVMFAYLQPPEESIHAASCGGKLERPAATAFVASVAAAKNKSILSLP